MSPYSLIDSNNRLYTACNIVTTVALLAIKEAASLSFGTISLSGIITLVTNYYIFEAIATSSLSDKKKFIPLQIALISLIILGSAIIHLTLISPVFFLSKILHSLINAKFSFYIEDLPIYMLLLAVISSPVQTFSESIRLFKGNTIVHNRLLQELRLINGASSERCIGQINSTQCLQFIISFVLEAITRGVREEIGSDQNTIVFEHSPVLASYLIVSVDESTTPTLNPSRFIEIFEYLQDLPQEIGYQLDREESFEKLVREFQKLSTDLQKKYYNYILQYDDLQRIVPNDLKTILEGYKETHIANATDVDVNIASGVLFTKQMLQFAKKETHLRTLGELTEIIREYTSLQSSFRKTLSHQPDNTNARKRITSLINSLYYLYEKNISPICLQFRNDTSDNDLEQSAWNFLATKFPYDFFNHLPTYLFSNTEDPMKLDKDFETYKLNTAKELITKVFHDDMAVFQASSKEQIIEKLIHYCTTNSPQYKIQFLKIGNEAYKIIKISTAIFSSIVVPILVNPLEFAMGSIYSILSKRRTSPASINNLSVSLFQGFFLSISSFGSVWAGCQFTSRYIVPLLD